MPLLGKYYNNGIAEISHLKSKLLRCDRGDIMYWILHLLMTVVTRSQQPRNFLQFH